MVLKLRKNPDYVILKEDNWKWMFLDGNSDGQPGYISYGQFIACAIWNQLKCTDEGKLSELRNQAQRIIERLNEIDFEALGIEQFAEIKANKFFDFYVCCDVNSEKALLITDQSKHCYPLLINSQKRIEGFKKTTDQLNKNFKEFFEALIELKSHNTWSQELELKLNKFYFE